jgi:hypothetical protein
MGMRAVVWSSLGVYPNRVTYRRTWKGIFNLEEV